MTVEISVAHPEWWWHADRDETLAWLGDPDVEDNRRRRHPDRTERHWEAIARAAAEAGRRMATGKPDPAWPGHVTVTIEDRGLDDVDLRIVRTWFADGDFGPGVGRDAPVLGDPADKQLTNGRHRLWWSFVSDGGVTLLPVRSATLGYLVGADAEGRAAVATGARALLDRMTTEQQRRSPRYADELRKAARARPA